MTTEERIEKALNLRAGGYSCSQCVLMSVTDLTGIDEDLSALIGAGLGGGVSTGEICGVANAMAISKGMMIGETGPTGKQKTMPEVKKLLTRFASPYDGRLTCRELKGKCGRSCEELIAEGITILSEKKE